MTLETVRDYCPICGSEVEMPADVLDGMAEAPRLIAEALRSAFSRPREGWSPGEIAAHLADVEIADGWRLRQTLAEDEPEVQPFDQDAWASALRYDQRDVETSLAAYAAARAAHVEIMSRLTDAEWERRFRHAEFGRLTLRTFVRHLADHDLEHLRQIHEG